MELVSQIAEILLRSPANMPEVAVSVVMKMPYLLKRALRMVQWQGAGEPTTPQAKSSAAAERRSLSTPASLSEAQAAFGQTPAQV